MKVFGIGMFKTGTTTLEHCLKILGMRHVDYQTDHIYFNGKSQGFLQRNLDKIIVDYDYDNLSNEEMDTIKKVVNNYDAFSDHPWMWCFKKCYELYPDSKFILTVRKDSQTVANSDRNFWKMNGASERDMPDDSEFIHRYETHNAIVREFFKDKNNYIELCWENGDDWNKLCKFLNIEIPSLPFPHANRGVYSK